MLLLYLMYSCGDPGSKRGRAASSEMKLGRHKYHVQLGHCEHCPCVHRTHPSLCTPTRPRGALKEVHLPGRGVTSSAKPASAPEDRGKGETSSVADNKTCLGALGDGSLGIQKHLGYAQTRGFAGAGEGRSQHLDPLTQGESASGPFPISHNRFTGFPHMWLRFKIHFPVHENFSCNRSIQYSVITQ